MTPAFDRKRLTTDLGLAAALAAALAAGWFVFAWRMAPDLLTAAYEQRSLPVINDRITGQNNLPLSFYLDAWLRVRGRLTVLVLGALAGLLLTAPFYRVALAWLGRQLRGGPTTGLVTLICIGGSAGWIGGAIEAAWEHQRHIDLPYGPSVEQFWLAPTAGAVTATLILLVLRASTGRAPISIRIATATIWSLVLFSVIRDSALGIHPVAAWLLAIGLGSQLAVFAGRRPKRAARWVRRALPAMMVVSVVTAASIATAEWRRERSALAALPAAPAGAPNVILLVIDTQNASRMGLHGSDRATTPNIDRLAERSVVFDMGLSTTSWTLPSHVSMLSGKWASEVDANFRVPVDAEPRMLAEVLADTGYSTAGFVANYGYIAARSRIHRGFSRYEDYSVDIEEWAESHWLTYFLVESTQKLFGIHRKVRKRAEAVNQSFLDWEARQSGPYFAFLNYFDVHDLYESPAPFNTLYRDPAPRHWVPTWGFSEQYSDGDVAEMLDAYDSSLTYLDDRLGELFAELEARGSFENTIFILTSDHGEHFGEKEMALHGNSLYLPVVQVPLLVSFPGRVPEGQRVESPASVRDIPATILDLAGIEAERLPGRSLRRFWEGDNRSDEVVYLNLKERTWFMPQDIVRHGTMNGVVMGPMHYIVDGRGVEELFDVRSDPGQETNLVGDPAHAEALERLREALARMPGPPSPDG